MNVKPMLAKSIDPQQIVTLANDGGIYFQQKLDGQRLMVHSVDRRVTLLNRSGEPSQIELSAQTRSDIDRLPAGEWALDCELVDDTLWVFDLAVAADLVELKTHFSVRHYVLEKLFGVWKPTSSIRILPVAIGYHSKVRLTQALLREGGEGIIARDSHGSYRPGKRSPEMLKVKFWRDIDCVVTDLQRNGKANIGLAVYDNNTLVDVGEVTALAGDGMNVSVGDVVCVKYLYAVDPDRPRLYQPTLPRLRDDKPAEQCTIDQLDNAYRNLNVLTDW